MHFHLNLADSIHDAAHFGFVVHTVYLEAVIEET